MVHRQVKLPYPSCLIVEICKSESAYKLQPTEGYEEVIREALNDTQYAVLRLRFIDRMTYKQIGDSVGLSPERVRQVLNRCLQKLSHHHNRKRILGV